MVGVVSRKRDVVPELCLNLNGSKCLVTTAVHLHGGKEPKWGKNPADCLFCALQVPFLPILSPTAFLEMCSVNATKFIWSRTRS